MASRFLLGSGLFWMTIVLSGVFRSIASLIVWISFRCNPKKSGFYKHKEVVRRDRCTHQGLEVKMMCNSLRNKDMALQSLQTQKRLGGSIES